MHYSIGKVTLYIILGFKVAQVTGVLKVSKFSHHLCYINIDLIYIV